MIEPRAAIFLAAGQGSRLRPLTEGLPKCLLPVQNRTILDTLLPFALLNPEREVIVVGGFCADYLMAHISHHYPKGRIQFVENRDYASDVNILSVDKGVSSLSFPERGYTIIETDLLMAPAVWQRIHHAENSTKSFWVTKDRYRQDLTGGIVHAPDGHQITDIAYVPQYNPAYDGWHKMVGILSVSPTEVVADIRNRQLAMKKGYMQYYMAPWIQHKEELPCSVVDIGTAFCRSFNTPSEYENAVHAYGEK